MCKTVFWDLDGTLIYCRSLWSKSVYDAIYLVDKDCNIDFQVIKDYMQTGYTWSTPYEDHTMHIGYQWWEHMFEYFRYVYRNLGVSKENADKASVLARELILNVDNFHLYDDSVDVLNECARMGIHNYVLSNNFSEIREILDKLDISKYFEGFIISADVGYDKPRREIFECAKKTAGYPEKCIMVGDNPVADMLGGRAAGMATILVHNEVSNCDVDYKCSTLTETLGVIRNI